MPAKVTDLLLENGRVTGVKTDKLTVHAKAVILTAGGYSANTKMLQKYNTYWDDIPDNMKTTNAPYITGDGINLGLEAGAALVGMGFTQMMPVADPKTGEYNTGLQVPPADFVMVNQKGDRFVNEYAGRDTLAKAAIAAGIETLLETAGVEPEQIETFYIAGGFGSHLNVASAVRIGLIPEPLAQKVTVIGNASLSGAADLLRNRRLAPEAEQIAGAATHVNLGGNPLFNEHYMEQMLFPEV